MAASFKYGAEAIALVGIAYGLIKWVGRTLRSLISDAPRDASRLEALGVGTPGASADALVRQGIVSAEQLAGMSPREREFLITTAALQLGATPARGTTSVPGSLLVVPARTSSARATPARPHTITATPPAPRLHLITPSRPPLGVAVHCPSCGAPLDRDALQRFGTTTCDRCKRPVSAHIQRGRLTVIVEETTDEAEHRRRLDGQG